MAEFPMAWLNTNLEDVLLSIVGGGTPSKSVPSYFDGNIPWMTVKDMNKNVLDDTVDHISPEAVENSSTNVIPAGTPIVATRMSLGKIVVARFDSAINQDLKALFHSEHINKDYLVYWYRSNARIVEELGTGTTVKGIRLEVLKALSFPVAPLAEQKVIAEKLDKLLAKVDSIKARLDAVPDTLKRFRQSVLAAAVSGKLTEDWRGNNAPSWKKCVLEDLIVTSANGLSKRSGKEGKDITVLRLADFKNAIRVEGNERKIKLNDKEQEKYSLNDGDILVIRVNGSVDLAGRFIEYKCKQNSESFCDHFIRLRLDSSKILPTFLTFIANEGDGRHYLQANLSTSAGQNTINQGTVKGLEIFLPEVIEQKQIICRVEQLFAYADKVEAEVKATQERVDKLTQSILAKAFRGELTAKWREQNPELISGDNSAEALLASIQKERKAEREKLKPKKKARTRKKA